MPVHNMHSCSVECRWHPLQQQLPAAMHRLQMRPGQDRQSCASTWRANWSLPPSQSFRSVLACLFICQCLGLDSKASGSSVLLLMLVCQGPSCICTANVALCRLPAVLPCWDHSCSTFLRCHCCQSLAEPAAFSRAFIAVFCHECFTQLTEIPSAFGSICYWHCSVLFIKCCSTWRLP